MPKKSLNINPFHGGLNEHSDARDIAHQELSAVENVAVADIGKVNLIGRGYQDSVKGTGHLKPGVGAFRFASDRQVTVASESPSQYLVVADGLNGYVYFYEKDSDGALSWWSSNISMGGAFSPTYYYADGILRVHDGDFTRSSKWFGYVDSGLYQEAANSNTPIHTITKFVTTDQKLKSFGDLSKTVAIRDATTANPSDANLGTHLNLAYWLSEGGSWSGIYEFGFAPVYKGGQEGPMTEASDQVVMFEHKLSIQLYVTTASHSPDDDDDHDLGDDRIVGVNVYFRENGNQDYFFLKSFDLEQGGKDRWLKYNGGTHTAYGFHAGTLALNADPASTSSYASTTMTVTFSNTASGFTGRTGFLRLIGGQVTPVYFRLTSLATANHSVPIINPGPGSRVFMVQLLDEDFNILKESAKRTVTISDSGSAVPPDLDPNDPTGFSMVEDSGDPADQYEGSGI